MDDKEKSLRNATLLSYIALGVGILSILLGVFIRPPAPPMPPEPQVEGRNESDVQEYMGRLNSEFDRLLLADVQKYGIDIYSVYINATQEARSPGQNFGKDKAFKKMQVTYPEANLLRIAEGGQVLSMLARNDVLPVEVFLEKKSYETVYCPDLMPTGMRLMPNLLSFLVQYRLERKEWTEAGKLLDVMELHYKDDYIATMGQGFSMPRKVSSFVEFQRKLLAMAGEKEK